MIEKQDRIDAINAKIRETDIPSKKIIFEISNTKINITKIGQSKDVQYFTIKTVNGETTILYPILPKEAV